MMEVKNFRALKIIFLKEDGSQLTLQQIDSLMEASEEPQKKWFLRGIKHILENHYTEAIKRFQLVDDQDAKFLILCCAYKIQDSYILQEYKDSLSKKGKLLETFSLRPYFVYEENLIEPKDVLFKD